MSSVDELIWGKRKKRKKTGSVGEYILGKEKKPKKRKKIPKAVKERVWAK